MFVEVCKILFYIEQIYIEGGKVVEVLLMMIVVVVVIKNFWVG